MELPCVRVRPEEGEATRQALSAVGLLDGDYEITVEDGWLYIPVTDADADALASHTVVEREVDAREEQTLPADLLGEAPSYERIGDLAIVDVDDPARAREVADAIVDSDLPVDSVIDRDSKVKGDLRVRDWNVLAGGTRTVHREYGFEYAVDLATVYFTPRLATERHRVAEQVETGERALDMFAGVGPFVIPFAAAGAEVVGADLNPAAVELIQENARRNGVADRVTAIQGDVREVEGYDDWADRLVMNLPHSADEFLETAVRLAGEDCVLHYYDIQGEDDPFGPGERAIRAAAEPAYEVTVETCRRVRSYAPGEQNVCLDVRLRR
ncbi:SAM-dependent methyltransferase [Halobacteriales archaeon QS_5_70_17]|nr:MAG: SAM-dependent methyltransferase [Halobacteriales archaeon QS_5_70_17]